jgi:hypothetical protein
VAYWLCRPSPARQEPRPVAHGSTSAAVLTGTAAALLGVALFALGLASMGPLSTVIPLWLAGRHEALTLAVAGSSEYLTAAPILGACAAIAIGTVSGWRLARGVWVLMILLVAFPAFVFAVDGDRRYLIPSVAVPIVSYCLSTGRRPRRTALVVTVPILFAILATIPFIRSEGGRASAGGILPALTQSVGDIGTTWDQFMSSYDTEMIESLSVEVDVLRMPDDMYLGAATVGDLLIAPIPSAVFPDKPTTARNQMLLRAYGAECGTPGGACPDFSAVGTFYQDLAFPGVVLGMALLGAFSRLIWTRFITNRSSTTNVLVLATWYVSLPILLRAGVMPAFEWWLFFLVPSLLIVRSALAITRRLPSVGTV